MLTAQQKKRENIAEYIIYMWQVEDLIRANHCDMNRIRATIIPQYKDLSPELQLAVIDWWDNLVEMMRLEHKEEKGHLQILVNTVNEMNTLHHQLLASPKYLSYQMQFNAVIPLIKELELKTQPRPENDIELMLMAIYSSFLLKLKGRPVTNETQQALTVFGRFLALLSKFYKDDQAGKIDWEDEV